MHRQTRQQRRFATPPSRRGAAAAPSALNPLAAPAWSAVAPPSPAAALPGGYSPEALPEHPPAGLGHRLSQIAILPPAAAPAAKATSATALPLERTAPPGRGAAPVLIQRQVDDERETPLAKTEGDVATANTEGDVATADAAPAQSSTTLTIEGVADAIPVHAIQAGADRTGKEVNVFTEVGPWATKLFQMAMSGEVAPSATLASPGFTWTGSNVMVINIQQGGGGDRPMVSFTLSAQEASTK